MVAKPILHVRAIKSTYTCSMSPTVTKSAPADQKSLPNVTVLKNDFVLQARGFCTDYSLPVSSCPLRELVFYLE